MSHQENDACIDEMMGIIRERIFDSPVGRSSQQIGREIRARLRQTHRSFDTSMDSLVRQAIRISTDLNRLEGSLMTHLQGSIQRLDHPTCMDRLVKIFKDMYDTKLLEEKYARLTKNYPLLTSDKFTKRLRQILMLYDDSVQLTNLFTIYTDMMIIQDSMRSLTDRFQNRMRMQSIHPLIRQGQQYRALHLLNILADIEFLRARFDNCPSIYHWLGQQADMIRAYRKRLNRMIPTLQRDLQERQSSSQRRRD